MKEHYYYCVYTKENMPVIVKSLKDRSEINFSAYGLTFVKEVGIIGMLGNRKIMRIRI